MERDVMHICLTETDMSLEQQKEVRIAAVKQGISIKAWVRDAIVKQLRGE